MNTTFSKYIYFPDIFKKSFLTPYMSHPKMLVFLRYYGGHISEHRLLNIRGQRMFLSPIFQTNRQTLIFMSLPGLPNKFCLSTLSAVNFSVSKVIQSNINHFIFYFILSYLLSLILTFTLNITCQPTSFSSRYKEFKH